MRPVQHLKVRFALGATTLCSALWKHDVVRPGIVGMRGSLFTRQRPCMKRLHPLPPHHPYNPGYDDNGDGAVHDPDRRHFPDSSAGGQLTPGFRYAEEKASSPIRAPKLGGRKRPECGPTRLIRRDERAG